MEGWENINSIQGLYRLLAHQYILECTQLDRIDARMREYPFIPRPLDKQDRFQKMDCMGLTFLYIRNEIHTERLNEDQEEILKEALQAVEICRKAAESGVSELNEGILAEQLDPAVQLVKETWRTVLAFGTHSDREIEIFPSLNGEGIVPANAIVFAFSTIQDYDGTGNVRDWDRERQKSNILRSLKRQLEPICEQALEVPVRFITV